MDYCRKIENSKQCPASAAVQMTGTVKTVQYLQKVTSLFYKIIKNFTTKLKLLWVQFCNRWFCLEESIVPSIKAGNRSSLFLCELFPFLKHYLLYICTNMCMRKEKRY